MKCSYHPEAEAVDICPACHRPVCDQCAVSLSGKNFCRACLESRVARLSSPAGKSRFWAFILSLAPGLGYMYLGLMKRGLQTMILFFGTIFVSSIARLDALMAFVLPVLIFYSVFDTQQILRKMNEGQAVEDRELFDWGSWENRRGVAGAALIILGAFALLNNMLPFYFNYHYHLMGRFIPPLLIIGAGIFILYRNTAGKGGDASGSGKQEE